MPCICNSPHHVEIEFKKSRSLIQAARGIFRSTEARKLLRMVSSSFTPIDVFIKRQLPRPRLPSIGHPQLRIQAGRQAHPSSLKIHILYCNCDINVPHIRFKTKSLSSKSISNPLQASHTLHLLLHFEHNAGRTNPHLPTANRHIRSQRLRQIDYTQEAVRRVSRQLRILCLPYDTPTTTGRARRRALLLCLKRGDGEDDR